MSYDIYIGNAELESAWPGEENDPVARWVVNGHTDPAAPSFPFDSMTGNSNSRHPGYSQWGEFCDRTGLSELFYGVASRPGARAYGGILSEHPGIVPLTPSMLATVRAARERWQEQHPGTTPGFDFCAGWHRAETDDAVRGRDHTLARLLWLEWWMEWALNNCPRPAIANH